MKRYETKIEVINPNSSYFGFIGTFHRFQDGFYRIGLIVTDSKGRVGPMEWFFYADEIREIN